MQVGVSDPNELDGRLREAAPEGRDLLAQQWHGDVRARLFGAAPRNVNIGRYRLLERIGDGASGEVWRAFDPELDRELAIKVLHGDLEGEAAHAAMVREAKTLAKLSHPNVVPVFDAGVHDGRVFVALELVRGSTLRQWMTTPRTWREIVEVFLQAARGLTAAHAAGVVHRDVKPENLLIGDDGRARVSDFGIARPTGVIDEAHGDTAPEGTTAGAGTPAYMAPEQFLGDPIDPRTDQFGLCTALHEALYGERPFVGRDRASLAANVIAGRRRTPADDRGVPRWLDRVVARGLSVDPARRFRDMHALVAALQPVGRRWWPTAVAVGAVAGITWLVWPDRGESAATCDDRSDRVGTVWNAEAAQAIREAFAASQATNADGRAAAIITDLDRFAEGWRAASARTCETDVDDDTRIAWRYCLQTRLLELESVADALAHADAAVVDHAARGGMVLPAPSECLALGTGIRAGIGDPEQHLELRAEIAQLRAKGGVGKLVEGLAASEATLGRARAVGNRSLEAEALLVRGELEALLVGLASEADPVATLHAAMLAAEAAHRLDLIALAAIASIEAEVAAGNYEGARTLVPRARAAVATLGDPPELAGKIDLALAEVNVMERADDEAAVWLEQARARFEAASPAGRRSLAQTLNLLGEDKFRRGEYEAARPDYARALDIAGTEFRSHRQLVANISGNLAETYFVVGDFDTAERYFAEGLVLRREMFGEDSVWVRHSLGHMGDISWERGESAQALAHYRSVLDQLAVAPVIDHESDTMAAVLSDLQVQSQRGWMHNGAALALVDLGRLDEALAHAERGDDGRLPEDQHHPDCTYRLDTRGIVLLAAGRHDEAVAAFAEALARLELTYPAEARAVAFAAIGLGRARIASGDRNGGVQLLQRGLASLVQTPAGYPRMQASARFALGQAWFADPATAERGREQVQAAIALLGDRGGAIAHERDVMVAWLRDHG